MGIDALTNLPAPSVASDSTAGSRPNVPAASAEPTPAPAARNQSAQQPTRAAVQAAAQQLQDYLATAGRTLEFRLDQNTGMTVVTVKDSESGDVIRQIPSEEVLKIAESLKASGGRTSNVLLSLTA